MDGCTVIGSGTNLGGLDSHLNAIYPCGSVQLKVHPGILSTDPCNTGKRVDSANRGQTVGGFDLHISAVRPQGVSGHEFTIKCIN